MTLPEALGRVGAITMLMILPAMGEKMLPKITIGDMVIMISFETLLRQLVPTFYILAAVYLSVSSYMDREEAEDEEMSGATKSVANILDRIHDTTFVRLPYVLLFGSTGVTTYMILNEPEWEWLPYGSTEDVWVLVVLALVLAIGMVLFITVLEKQQLKRPRQYAKDYAEMAKRLFS